MDYEIYRIPANFTDAGKILGQFPIRNAVEAVVFAVPPGFLCFSYLPFSLTVRIIVALALAVPLMGFALSGINDDPLTVHLRHLMKWMLRRGVISYRGTPKHGKPVRTKRKRRK